MRTTLAVLAVAVVAVLAANILGEYELTPLVAAVSGLVIGFGLAELGILAGRWRGPLPVVLVAVLAGLALLWAGWIDSDEGVEPFPATAWLGAVAAAGSAALRTLRAPGRA